jgi:hypothetical protein
MDVPTDGPDSDVTRSEPANVSGATSKRSTRGRGTRVVHQLRVPLSSSLAVRGIPSSASATRSFFTLGVDFGSSISSRNGGQY